MRRTKLYSFAIYLILHCIYLYYTNSITTNIYNNNSSSTIVEDVIDIQLTTSSTTSSSLLLSVLYTMKALLAISVISAWLHMYYYLMGWQATGPIVVASVLGEKI